MRRRYSEEELLESLRRFKEEFGRVPRHRDFVRLEGYPAANSLVKYFKTWNNALKSAGLQITMSMRDYNKISPTLKAYEKDISQHCEEVSIRKKMMVLYDLEEFLKSRNKEWKDLTVDDAIDWLNYLKQHGTFKTQSRYQTKGNSPRTLRGKFRILTAFLTFILDEAEMNGRKPLIPAFIIKQIKKKCKMPKVIGRDMRKSERRALSEEQIAEIRSNIKSPVNEVLFSLGLNLGLRSIEYERLKLEYIHLDEGYIDVLGKGNKFRDVALTEEMRALVEYQLSLRNLNKIEHEYFFFNPRSKKPLKKRQVNLIYNKLCNKTDLRNGMGKKIEWNAHELRYSMDSFMVDRGVSINVIAQRMGHTSTLTEHYGRKSIDERIKILQEKVGIL